RSLYNIISGCLATLFACSWSAYYPNVPTANRRKKKKFLGIVPYSDYWFYRVKWLCLTIIAPEVVFSRALDECLTAMHLVLRPHHKLSMVHVFFFGMNGFVESDGRPCSLPVDPRDFIRLATVAKDDIEDKSKSDGFKKLILTVQILWFIIQFGARYRQGTKDSKTAHLEVLTVAIAVLSCTTSLLWWYKPLEV
ncbi:hypothetical protein BDZ89DRAFT_906123, partial [Hymenopellis radicata]